MRTTGITRKVDDLGRVVIPAGIRRALGIGEGDTVEVALEGDRVVMAKPTDRCVFCADESAPLRTFHDRNVCAPCVVALAGLRLDATFPPAVASIPDEPAQSAASRTAW